MVESLSRKELQKLCAFRRKTGDLPKGTKCNGTTSELVEILSKESIKKRKAFSENLFRHLAPYLTYDKLLLVVAHYPSHPLLEELRSSKGKIWSDRVWVELGEPPIVVKKGGIRYHHLWSSLRLAPWGYLYFNEPTKIRAQQAAVGKVFDGSDRHLYAIWAITPRGLEYFQTKDDPTFIAKTINEKKRWKLVSTKRFIFVAPLDGYYTAEAYVLDLKGNLSIISRGYYEGKIGSKETLIRSGVRYIQKVRLDTENLSYLYGIDFSGEHFALSNVRREVCKIAKVPQGTRGLIRPPSDYFQRFVYRTNTPGFIWTLCEGLVLSGDTNKALKPYKLYYRPIGDNVLEFYDMHRFLPKDYVDSNYLGIDGHFYFQTYDEDYEGEEEWFDRVTEPKERFSFLEGWNGGAQYQGITW